jgi:hypothetical protein
MTRCASGPLPLPFICPLLFNSVGATRFLPILLAAGLPFLCSCARDRPAGLEVDGALESELRQITAIDNHAHPVKVVTYGEEDGDYDALPADAIADLALPPPFRENSNYFPQAWRALFGYPYSDASKNHVSAVSKARQEMMKQKGDLYPSWVLNHTSTDIMLANRVAMGRGLPGDRFKWVPFVDMFLFPLNNSSAKNKDPEHNAFFGREEALLKGYLAAAQMRKIPSTFDDYLSFVSHTLESWKSSGAVAVKFELAFLRDLQISHPPRESAERVYTIYAQSSEPSVEEYKILQDYLFGHLAREAGRLGLPVHIHCSIGAGSYFRTSNADPLALESVFNDPALRKTKFVMLHGAWPFAPQAAALILKPNVYVDYSGFSYLTYPAEAARALRLYLEAAPERVLYGSDASPFSSSVGWEETAWLGARYGRLALGMALTGMMRDGEITPDGAKSLGRKALRENARQLYGF